MGKQRGTNMDNQQRFVLPWIGKPKPRPRVTKHGTFNDPVYTAWKEDIAEWMGYQKFEIVEGPMSMAIAFNSTNTIVRVKPLPDYGKRAKFLRFDVDNGAGGIMDALEMAGLYANDRQVVDVRAAIANRAE